MRVSPVDWAFNTIEETLRVAELSALPTMTEYKFCNLLKRYINSKVGQCYIYNPKRCEIKIVKNIK